MTRSEIRDSAFKLVFEQLLRDDNIEELYEIAEEIEEITVNDEVKAIVNGSPRRINACTRCLRSGKVTRAD